MPVLQFKGKTAVENYHHTVPHHRLEFDAKLSLLGKGEKPSLDGNLIIEGDNLLALKALLPTHAGKVKCIYIDPPYNTGNEGWVYNDNLTQPQFKEWIGRTVGKEGEDACRHDKWCCMMYPRLTLLKELLHKEGAIFVSVDDHEVHQLRELMDEIFGVENLLATIVWKPRYSPPNDHQGIAEMHDFVVAYRKSDAFQRGLLPRSESAEANYSNPDEDPRGDWNSIGYIGNKSRAERPNSWFPITRPTDGKEIWPDESAVWRFSPTTHQKNVREDRLYWGPDGMYDKPRFKKFRFEVKPGVVPGSWWEQDITGNSDQAKRQLTEIFGKEGVFPNPKPVALIQQVLRVASDEDDFVLDSFAGSGTTAQAVLEMNKEDGGNRKFILVQQSFDTNSNKTSDYNICKLVTSERVRRVMRGYQFAGKKTDIFHEEKIGLRTFKKAEEALDRIESAKSVGQSSGFDDVKAECKDGFLRVFGTKSYKDKFAGLGGIFTYVRVGEPLFGEYKDFGEKLPAYEDIAKYVFYTETSHEFPGTTKKQNPPWDKAAGRIGEHAGRSYYLLYEPNERQDRGLDRKFLNDIASKDSNRELIVYCERLAVHQDELRKFHREHGKKIRPMLVPFNLK